MHSLFPSNPNYQWYLGFSHSASHSRISATRSFMTQSSHQALTFFPKLTSHLCTYAFQNSPHTYVLSDPNQSPPKVTLPVMTVTVPTPVHPILTYLRHSQVIRIIPEHPMPLPNPLAPSRANSCLSNALPNPLTPLCLVDAFPTRCSFNLSSPSHQVDFRHPHSFLTQCHLTFSLLRQVYS